MTTETLKETIRQEMTDWLQQDPSVRTLMLDLIYSFSPSRIEFEDRFNRIIDQLERDRIEQRRKWDEQDRKWDANQAELKRMRDESNAKWEEQNRKWDANQAELKNMHEQLMAQGLKHDRSIGALGARWGMQAESTFRNALAAILEKNFEVQVINYNGYDETGEVFGRPEQIELDVIIKNGLLILCELKSSIDKGGMYVFERKARYYERHHQRVANRLLVISPMIDKRARSVAEKLGIECYDDSLDVEQI